MKKIYYTSALFIAYSCISLKLLGQTSEEGDNGPTPSGIYIEDSQTPNYQKYRSDASSSESSTLAPLDGGISILLAAGVAVGIRKAYRNKQKNGS